MHSATGHLVEGSGGGGVDGGDGGGGGVGFGALFLLFLPLTGFMIFFFVILAIVI